ncbi:MAG: nucleotidyltransferase domain-containing protein [Bacteroidia bacterium]|nr:nucleotidyltransferase domain-containing protein [Bacteroidia bacterium]
MIESKEHIISKLKSLLQDKVKFAIIYGSVLKENFNDESDIDLAIFFNDPKHSMSSEQHNKFRYEINTEFTRDIDIIVLNNSDIIITMQTLANGDLIINNDNSFFNLFKARKIGEYIDFKMNRKIIETNLLNGRLYA